MARRMRTWVSLLWLLPPLAVAGLWVRSYGLLDEFSGVNRDNVLRAAVSYRGAVHWVRSEKNGTPRRLAWDTYDVPAGATWGDLYALDDVDWRHAGFAQVSAPKPATVAPAPAVKVRPKVAPWLFTPPYVAYAVPYWPVLAATSVPALRVVVRLFRRWRRARHGWCPGCGYDLRAATDRCPECGEAIGGRRRVAA